jgi:hypothetical protein
LRPSTDRYPYDDFPGSHAHQNQLAGELTAAGHPIEYIGIGYPGHLQVHVIDQAAVIICADAGCCRWNC